ncbi:ABC transporter permease [Amycolatopsis vancoresmycina]|uniref:Proline/glycine/betaine ABC transporter permease n=1 Tax=Amycolatopsis vancoresmycina DSM 44592 TaxID=1292037 RepID=R1FWL8_9PSEU|nr:ABC transporter permease [Amycolatopsis vancoresmycina]EOD63757.1 proline/glycine/betaine ABC transporter permease [Amycolatopsis vancoresmycina DSM 44592]
MHVTAVTPLAADSGPPIFQWRWVDRNADAIVHRLVEHISLTGAALGIGLVVSIGLSVLALRYRWSYGIILGTAGALYVIPSLGAFAVLAPFFGLTFVTAMIPLATYTLLILVRNIVTGVDQVPKEVREAAIGMGYTRTRMLWQIELPLALPVVIAGLRVAAVTTIGLVTVTSMLGLGGLGYFIRAGIQNTTPNPTEIIVGMGLSVVLAVVVDLLLWLGERLLTPWTRKAR